MRSVFFTAVSWRVFSLASLVVAGMVSLKLYGLYFGKVTWGILAAASTLLGYLTYLDGGFRTTINQNILAEPEPAKKLELIQFCQSLYSNLMLVFLGTGLLLMLGYAFTPTAKESGIPVTFFLAMGLVGGATVVTGSQINLLIGLQRQSQMFMLSAASAWLGLGTLWLSLRGGLGVWAFPLSSLASAFIPYPVALWLIRSQAPGIRFFTFRKTPDFWQRFHALKKDAFSCFRSQVSIVLLFSIDVVLGQFFCPAADAAIYILLWKMFGYLRQFLQSTGEAAWPIMAERGSAGHEWSLKLLRFNSWIYGSALGAACLTLPPFLEWFMGKGWVAPKGLVYLIGFRCLVTGVSSPTSYFLQGLGKFRELAIFVERELVAAVAISLLLVKPLGIYGVAVGFLLSTAFGTFTPILRAYTRSAKLSLTGTLTQIWWRAGLAGAVSFLAAGALWAALQKPALTPAIGAVSALAGLTTGLLIAWLRRRPAAANPGRGGRFREALNGL